MKHTFRNGFEHDAHQHPNGGGWVRDGVDVPESVYVGPRAEILGGTIRGGTIEGGTIRGGTIWGGTIEGGTIRGGTIEGGTIRGGTIEGGTIEGGEVYGGMIWGGTIRGGTIEGGMIEGGIIHGGTVTRDPVFIAGFAYPITITDTHMGIGCQWHTKEHWRENGKAIAKANKQPLEMLKLALALMESHDAP